MGAYGPGEGLRPLGVLTHAGGPGGRGAGVACGQHGWLRQHGWPEGQQGGKAEKSQSQPGMRDRVVVEGTTPSERQGGCGVQESALRQKGMRGMGGLWPAGVASAGRDGCASRECREEAGKSEEKWVAKR
jgi:hypothetical protein